jgi:hypothetical protein
MSLHRLAQSVSLSSLLLGLAAGATTDTKLTIVRPTLHEGDDGPPIVIGFRYMAGDIVFFSFQVSGYKKLGAEPDEKVDVAYEMNVRDSKGILLDPPNVGSVGTGISHEDKDWLPKVRYQFPIPPLADPGEYKISLKLWDRFAKTETSLDMPFQVAGRVVEPSDTLVVRNFRFLRSEEDKNPLAVAAYRPGDTVWARFDMTGYKFGPGNQFGVEYDVAVALADGTVTYSQPHAAEEKTKTFYPQRYTPGIASLNVPPDLKKGEYILIVTVRDTEGSQTAETRQKFTVE